LKKLLHVTTNRAFIDQANISDILYIQHGTIFFIVVGLIIENRRKEESGHLTIYGEIID